MTAYRIAKIEDNWEIGDAFFPTNRDFNRSCFESKKRVEEALEKARPKGFPSRRDCVFVCFSEENAEEWARCLWLQKPISCMSYKILKLEITDKVYWFQAEKYNSYHDTWTDEKLEKAAIEYWSSYAEASDDLEVGFEWEGLLDGDARIVDITVKNITTIDYKALVSNE